MRDNTPMTSLVSSTVLKVLENTYRGDVPISPYTIPMVWNAKLNVLNQLVYKFPPIHRPQKIKENDYFAGKRLFCWWT